MASEHSLDLGNARIRQRRLNNARLRATYVPPCGGFPWVGRGTPPTAVRPDGGRTMAGALRLRPVGRITQAQVVIQRTAVQDRQKPKNVCRARARATRPNNVYITQAYQQRAAIGGAGCLPPAVGGLGADTAPQASASVLTFHRGCRGLAPCKKNFCFFALRVGGLGAS